MSETRPRHRARPPRSRRIAKSVFVVGSVVLAVVLGVVVIAYKHLEGNITAIDISNKLGDRPAVVERGAINVLVMGSDTREGANGIGIGGSTPGLSDTTILLHLSKNREFAYGVSLPRDAMVEQPPCEEKDGTGVDPGGLKQFNAAYAIGGPACTVKTVEQLTGIRIQHFIVVDFVGFKNMVNAIDGVTICVPTEVNDTIGHIKLPAGTYKVNGEQALDYVRVRHDLGAPTGDIGRMKRQQTFIAAMIDKVVSKGTLANPVRLYNFLDAATRSLTTDPGFANLKELASLGKQLKGIGMDRIQFITVPWEPWSEDANRVVWKPEARQLWQRINKDLPLGPFAEGAVSPGEGQPTQQTGAPSPSSSPSESPTESPSESPSESPTESASPGTPTGTPTQSEEEARQAAEAAGLCV
ncbi:MAG TPA: LCP family protein [Marmoricola sp.]|nr:LCP family protein [Marmoricola sp.]